MTTKMKAPEGGTGCSFDGIEYEVDSKGCVTVPEEAVPVLSDHGFTLYVEPADGGKKGGK